MVPLETVSLDLTNPIQIAPANYELEIQSSLAANYRLRSISFFSSQFSRLLEKLNHNCNDFPLSQESCS